MDKKIRKVNEIPASVGLIGVGLVGTALADRFLANDITVIGYDVDDDRLDNLERMGGCRANNPSEIAQNVSHIVLSLPDTSIVRKVIEGPDGILGSQKRPAYIIDTTTGDPEETIELAQRLANQNISFLDATICGASSQIQKGEGVFMVGGESTAYEECSSLLHLLAKQVFYVGSPGSGSKAKLATNLVLGLNRLVLAEGMVFAEKLGLPLDTFLKLLKVSPAYSVAVDVKGEKMLKSDFNPASRVHQHHKDVSLILKYARLQHQDLPLSQVHYDILGKAIEAGDRDLDSCAVIKEVRRRTIKDINPKRSKRRSSYEKA